MQKAFRLFTCSQYCSGLGFIEKTSIDYRRVRISAGDDGARWSQCSKHRPLQLSGTLTIGAWPSDIAILSPSGRLPSVL